jgi:formamidopyrimidine-DNA glycosylase
MPELPEVETVRRGLAAQIIGRTFTGIGFLEWPRTIEAPAPEELARRIAGRRVVEVRRRAKFLLVALDSGEALTIHLRMTGQVTIAPRDAPRDRFERVALAFADGDELRFSDIRRFGRIALYDRDALAARFRDLGPEPLGDDWARDDFVAALARRRTRLKPLLLDQGFLAGLGNIYVDESLFRAGLHPLTLASAVTPAGAARLYETIRAVLGEAIASGGTTFSNYRDAFGNEGDYYEHRRVYGRTDEPCPTCGTAIARIVVGGRGTHFCPRCQPLPDAGVATIVQFPVRAAQRDRLVAEPQAGYTVSDEDGTEDGR